MSEWTFITNHAAVFSIIAKNPRVTAREIAEVVNITERAVRKIIADLETEGYLKKKKEGRRIHYSINSDLNMRHVTQREKSVGSLLAILGWDNK